MKVLATELPGVLLLEPRVFSDNRGFFYESYNRQAFAQATGYAGEFVQDNHSHSIRGVLRGIHYQIKQPQGKLIRVVAGEGFDVAGGLPARPPRFRKKGGFSLNPAGERQGGD